MRINIVNLTKRNSLYQQGMPIKILSLRKAQDQGATWGFGGTNIRYGISKVMKNSMLNFDCENTRKRVYYQISFDYTFEYDDDQVFFAYSTPYTFSMVTNLVS